MNSKVKGNRAEREICGILTSAGFPAHRNDQQIVGGYNNPDVTADGLESYHFEVKRTERLRLDEAMEQAKRDAAGRIPAVVHRKNRQAWLITMHLEDWLEVIRN